MARAALAIARGGKCGQEVAGPLPGSRAESAGSGAGCGGSGRVGRQAAAGDGSLSRVSDHVERESASGSRKPIVEDEIERWPKRLRVSVRSPQVRLATTASSWFLVHPQNVTHGTRILSRLKGRKRPTPRGLAPGTRLAGVENHSVTFLTETLYGQEDQGPP